jgi:hypothetical protein
MITEGGRFIHPRVIWLQPWCDGCEAHHASGEGRLWCEDNVWGKCDECGKKAIRYVMSRQKVEEATP